MKVIGIVTAKQTVLVEMSTKELANIGGETYHNSTIALTSKTGQKYEAEASAAQVGDALEVTPIFEEARTIVEAHADVNKTLSKVKGSITTYQNAVKTRGDA